MTAAKELADQISKAMEGVSAGRWCQFHPSYAPEAEGTPFSDWDSSHDMSAVKDDKRTKRLATFKHANDAAYVDATQPDNMRVILSSLADAERERDELRVGIKRLSDEEELCSETDDGDAFDLVRLAAKLARSERKTRDVERELTDTQTAIHAMSEDHEELKAKLSEAVKVMKAIEHWASHKCPCHEETPNPCTLCGASVENLEACKAVESIFPRDLLRDARSFIASMKGGDA